MSKGLDSSILDHDPNSLYDPNTDSVIPQSSASDLAAVGTDNEYLLILMIRFAIKSFVI